MDVIECPVDLPAPMHTAMGALTEFLESVWI